MTQPTTQYKVLKRKVDNLVELLHYDLNTANATAFVDYTGDDSRLPIGELAFALGVYEECLSQARMHLKQFEKDL